MTDPSDVYTPGAGLPLAIPLGSSEHASLAQVRREFEHLRGTDTPRTSPEEQDVTEFRRVSRRVLDQLAEILSDRDRVVLSRVDQHRYLTTLQLQRFAFVDHVSLESAARTTRRVLSRLERFHLLYPVKRRIGGVRSGSSARVWQLTPAAARLLRYEGAVYRRHEPSMRFLAHCLAVADVHLAFRDLQSDARIERVEVQTEPDSWRPYAGIGGERRLLQPDLAAVLSTGRYDDRFFIEVDLGTESLPTLLRKCGQYEDYRSTGIEQSAHGAFPLVLWFFTKPERAERLQLAVGRSPRLTPGLFRYVTPHTLTQTLVEGVG